MKHAVEYVATRPIPTMTLMEDRYAFVPVGGRIKRKLQELAWHLLLKTGAVKNAVARTVRQDRFLLDRQEFMANLSAQREDLATTWNREATSLLIGSDDFVELMKLSRTDPQFFRFDVPADPKTRFMGLDVQVIPWMRGMVVLP